MYSKTVAEETFLDTMQPSFCCMQMEAGQAGWLRRCTSAARARGPIDEGKNGGSQLTQP